MASSRLRAHRADRPSLADEPKHFTRVPDDALEDPRLTKATLAVFMNLLKGTWTDSRVVYISQLDLAGLARVTDRCVRSAMKRLKECGYIRYERDYDRWGGPYRIELCYELRPSLKLESQPPVTSGSKSACNRNGGSGLHRKPGSGPSLFEREIKEETTTEAVVENTSSFSQIAQEPNPEPAAMPKDPEVMPHDPPEDPPDDPELPSIEALVMAAKEQWPDEPNLGHRIAGLAAKGLPETALAIEYARLRKAKTFAYVATTVSRWWADGWDLEDIQAEVWALTPKPVKPTVCAPLPKPPPMDEETTKLTEELLSKGRWWVPSPENNPAAGQLAKVSPRPAGDHDSIPGGIPGGQPKHRMNECTRQEPTGKRAYGQRARQDSNLQPSDSKSATLTSSVSMPAHESDGALGPPSHGGFYAPEPPCKPPD